MNVQRNRGALALAALLTSMPGLASAETYSASRTLGNLILTISNDFKPRVVPEVDRTEFHYQTSKGADIAYRPAIGADQIEALNRKGASPAEQNTIIHSRCIKTVDGQLVINPLDFARAMPMRDRTALLDLLIERQPTVDLSVTINCAVCREEQTISLGWGDLFRP